VCSDFVLEWERCGERDVIYVSVLLVSGFGFCAVTDDDDCESAGEFGYGDDECVVVFILAPSE
jgi:hypothetical protein